MRTTAASLRGAALCVLLTSVHVTWALFGDDRYWTARKKIDCALDGPSAENVCDGIAHCADESDEEQCVKCRGRDAFHCDNNRCVTRNVKTTLPFTYSTTISNTFRENVRTRVRYSE